MTHVSLLLGGTPKSRVSRSCLKTSLPGFPDFKLGLWDHGAYPHFCDKGESPLCMGG